MSVLNVWYGSGENAWLSNLAKRNLIDADTRVYVSIEHAYQSWKSGQFDLFTYQQNWKAGKKIIGRKAKTGGNWNIKLMERLVLRSVDTDPSFKLQLQLLPKDVSFTHEQDKGIWRTEFPRILEMARAYA